MCSKVFPLLPSVVCSRNLNDWTRTAVLKVEARRYAAKHKKKPGSSSSDSNNDQDEDDDIEVDDLFQDDVPPIIRSVN